MFTISLCMIVKNEEKTLGRILKIAQNFADEIIIVDTGSTDKIFDFTWCDDFSKARNFSFSKATCDYQMWLDADDVITDENVSKIIALKTNFDTSVDVFEFKYSTCFDQNNHPVLTYFRERLLKRNDHFFWQGFVIWAVDIA